MHGKTGTVPSRLSNRLRYTIKKHKKIHALVDADVLVFRAGMAGQYTLRSAYLPEVPECPIVTLRYMKDLKDWLEDNGYDMDDVEITKRSVIEPLPTILHTTKMMINKIKMRFKDVTFYLSAGDNFREDVATEMPYKGNRWSKEKREAARKDGKWLDWLDSTEGKYTEPVRPFWEEQIKSYIRDKHKTIDVFGEEADDALGIAQTKMGRKSCIVSVDKDLKMIEGYHLNMADLEGDVESVNTFKANLNFYGQLLTGDATDNIPGIKGIGAKKKDKILDVESMDTAEDMFMVVWEQYLKAYLGFTYEHIYNVITERGRLLWIRREDKEIWTPPITLSTLSSIARQES